MTGSAGALGHPLMSVRYSLRSAAVSLRVTRRSASRLSAGSEGFASLEFQICMPPASPASMAVTMVLPSGLNAAELTVPALARWHHGQQLAGGGVEHRRAAVSTGNHDLAAIRAQRRCAG